MLDVSSDNVTDSLGNPGTLPEGWPQPFRHERQLLPKLHDREVIITNSRLMLTLMAIRICKILPVLEPSVSGPIKYQVTWKC